MSRVSCTRGMRLVVLLIVSVAVLPASIRAGSLSDPTRPAVRPSVSIAKLPGLPAPQWVLQSVLLSPSARSAIINGVLVPLGGRIGAAQLVEVHEDEAVLQVEGHRRSLRLFPAARKEVSRIGASPVIGNAVPRRIVQNAYVVSVVHRRRSDP
ncbi:MAG TPA: hypothetical protein VFA81_05875 [Burkholderiales bacterium]|nr:hypothetical protein [Burkholderiales bacterium]